MKFTLLAGALAVAAGFLSTTASAQDQGGDAFYEMAALDTGDLGATDYSKFVPVPTPRPSLTEPTFVSTAAPVEIRRTAEGIRMVGPRFFPEN